MKALHNYNQWSSLCEIHYKEVLFEALLVRFVQAHFMPTILSCLLQLQAILAIDTQ